MKREIIFVFFLTVSAYQLDMFAADMNEADYMRMMMRGESVNQNPKPVYDLNGLTTEIIPENNEYVVGKPMRFSVVLANSSDVNKTYFDSFFKPFTIKNPDGNCAYDKIGPYQTLAGSPKTIASGEVVTLVEKKDVSEEYLIIKPGKYTVIFCGGPTSPACDLEFEVKAGKPFDSAQGRPDIRDEMIAALKDILPDSKWQVTVTQRRFGPSGRFASQNLVVINRGFLERGAVRIMLWQSQQSLEAVDANDLQTSEYLGKNKLGYYYIEIPPRALELWPRMKEDIIKALKLEDVN